MIINSVLPSSLEVIEKIKIKPFARALLDGTTSAWIENDPSSILNHATITITPNSRQIQQRAEAGYQVITYFRMVAVYSDGREVDLKDLANAGRIITASIAASLTPSSPNVGSVEIFNNQQLPGIWGSGTLTCPNDISSKTIIGYNDGTDATIPGCFLYISAKTNSASYSQTTMNFSSMTINGATYPVELSTDWGDR